jgi:hypothetical protein
VTRCTTRFAASFGVLTAVSSLATSVHAGPETALRELASGQIKKGVRSIGMGGDGATFGNYSLVYGDAGTALVDYGMVRFTDTGNTFSFTAVGLTTPKFWDGAALYLIAMSQHATGIETWSLTAPAAAKPPSIGDGSNQAVFLKFAKPITKELSFGVLLSYELSQMTLVPHDGAPAIRFETAWRPSGGAGFTYKPAKWLLMGARVILNHDWETRTDGKAARSARLRSYEYRAGVALLPWEGTIFDVGTAVLDRYNGLEDKSTLELHPTLGVEQALVAKRVWLRAGLDETTWTSGMSIRIAPLKLDLAYLRNLAAARTGDVFGRTNAALFGTLSFDYETAK